MEHTKQDKERLTEFFDADENKQYAILFDSLMTLIADGVRDGEDDNIIRNYARLASEIYFRED